MTSVMTLDERQKQAIKQLLLEFLQSKEGRQLIQEIARECGIELQKGEE
jgi:predicted transcriptional regulator